MPITQAAVVGDMSWKEIDDTIKGKDDVSIALNWLMTFMFVLLIGMLGVCAAADEILTVFQAIN